MDDIAVLQVLMIGVTTGIAGAGGFGWYMVRKYIMELEERFVKQNDCATFESNILKSVSDKFVSKDDCSLLFKLNHKDTDVLMDSITELKEQLKMLREENNRQYHLIFKMLNTNNGKD